MKMLNKAIVVRTLVKAGKTVYVMREGDKLTHTTVKGNVDSHSLIGVYSDKGMTATQINDDLHFALRNSK